MSESPHQYVRWSREAVDSLGVRDRHGDYLVEHGLLRVPGSRWQACSIENGVRWERGMPVLVMDHQTPLCWDVAARGQIVAFYEGERCLVNSNVESLGVFLEQVQRFAELDGGTRRGAAFRALYQEVDARLRECDAAAMVTEGYWIAVIEEIHAGVI